MHPSKQEEARLAEYRSRVRWCGFLVIACGLMLLAGLLCRPRQAGPSSVETGATQTVSTTLSQSRVMAKFHRHNQSAMPEQTAEEIVAGKLGQFARSRRDFAYALAGRHNVKVSDDVDRFFAAVESGNWDDIEATFHKINGDDSSASWNNRRPADVEQLWPAIIDAYGVAEQVHLWPAEQLLDYGNAVLAALRPGMVYVGGTDNGRWVPEFLNDTSNGEQHIVITQNGLAASDYLDYLRLQYDDRLKNLSEDDSKQAFANYVADAQKRMEHDQQFPTEPKQVLPGEDIKVVDGKVQVSGQVAVMEINEKLLQALMQKNPDLSFAIQESFPLRGTYGNALPLGPLMELGAGGEQNPFTSDQAAQSVDYWRNAAQQILSEPSAMASDTALKSYSHDAVSAANLLAAHNFGTEAEEAYRLATQLWPGNPEATGSLAGLLAGNGREAEAKQLLDAFAQKYPDQQKAVQHVSASMTTIWTPKSSGH